MLQQQGHLERPIGLNRAPSRNRGTGVLPDELEAARFLQMLTDPSISVGTCEKSGRTDVSPKA